MRFPLFFGQSPNRAKQGLALLRIGFGLFFLQAGWQKLGMPEFSTGLASQLQSWAAQNPYPFYQTFLNQVAIPNASLFTRLVIYGEILVGASLIVGLLSSYALCGAILMNLNYFLAMGNSNPVASSINLLCVLCGVSLLYGNSSETYGLDRWLQPSTNSSKATKKVSPSKAKAGKTRSASKKTGTKKASKSKASKLKVIAQLTEESQKAPKN